MKINNRIFSVSAAAVLLAVTVAPMQTFAEDTTLTHTVTVVDFKGNTLEELTVPHGGELDLSGIDTSALTQNLDTFTQIGFSSWSAHPDTIYADITVQALFVKMKISCESIPAKTEYYSKKTAINTDGLKVTIHKTTQLPEMDNGGDYLIEEDVVDITKTCSANFENAAQAFGDSDRAAVSITPPRGNQPIIMYNISYFPNLGDIDLNKTIDAADATNVLMYYSQLSTGGEVSKDNDFVLRCDIDRDGKVDAVDASYILRYYAKQSTTALQIDWDMFFEHVSQW